MRVDDWTFWAVVPLLAGSALGGLSLAVQGARRWFEYVLAACAIQTILALAIVVVWRSLGPEPTSVSNGLATVAWRTSLFVSIVCAAAVHSRLPRFSRSRVGIAVVTAGLSTLTLCVVAAPLTVGCLLPAQLRSSRALARTELFYRSELAANRGWKPGPLVMVTYGALATLAHRGGLGTRAVVAEVDAAVLADQSTAGIPLVVHEFIADADVVTSDWLDRLILSRASFNRDGLVADVVAHECAQEKSRAAYQRLGPDSASSLEKFRKVKGGERVTTAKMADGLPVGSGNASCSVFILVDGASVEPAARLAANLVGSGVRSVHFLIQQGCAECVDKLWKAPMPHSVARLILEASADDSAIGPLLVRDTYKQQP